MSEWLESPAVQKIKNRTRKVKGKKRKREKGRKGKECVKGKTRRSGGHFLTQHRMLMAVYTSNF